MGEFIAWIIGWDLVLEYAVGAATVGISWSRYLVKFLEGFDVHLPPEMTARAHGMEVLINLPAVFIIVLDEFITDKRNQRKCFCKCIIVALKVAVVLDFYFPWMEIY